MALHVDGGGPVSDHSAALRPGGDHLLDTGQTTPDDAPAAERHAGDQIVVQGKTGQPAGIAGQDFGRHHDVARFKGRIQSAGDTEADDTPDRGGIEYRQQRPQLLRVATAADDGHAGAGRDTGLLHQTSHNQHRPRVHSIAHGRVVPCPQIHIPTPTT